MRRIAVVMYQTSNSKGQELVAQRMVKWFRIYGYDAWLITSVYHDGDRVLELGDDKYEYFEKDPFVGIPTIRVKSYKASWPPRRVMFEDFIDVLNKLYLELGFDAIITHSTLWNGPEETAKWILWYKIYSLLEPCEIRPPVYAHMSHYQPPDPTRYSAFERSYRMSWNYLVMPAIFKAADLILCTTPIEAEDMMHMGAPPTKIFIFPGGLDDDEARLIDEAKPDYIVEKYGLPKDKKIIAYLGTIEERKNPLAVVRVAAKLRHRKDVVFVIAGRPGDQWDEVVREAKTLDNVYVLGELSTYEKASLIKASYLNIILSKMEALGLTQIEFMYGGVPVITSGVYGQRWVIRHGIEGLHTNGPDDVEGAAKAIEKLLDDERLYEELSRNARERGKAFLMSSLMKDLIERIEAIIRSGREDLAMPT